jgi:hypothetical protein
VLQTEFLRRFNEAMQLRGKASNEAQSKRAWAEIGDGKADSFIDDALWHFERNQGANFATALSEARTHAFERKERRTAATEGVSCDLCGGHCYVRFPKYYPAGKARQADSVECKSIPKHPGSTHDFPSARLVPSARPCVCIGGEPFPQDVLESWERRKTWVEYSGRYQTLAEWAFADEHWIVLYLVAPNIRDLNGIDARYLTILDERLPLGPIALADVMALQPAGRRTVTEPSGVALVVPELRTVGEGAF